MLDREKTGINVHRIKYKLGTILLLAFPNQQKLGYFMKWNFENWFTEQVNEEVIWQASDSF